MAIATGTGARSASCAWSLRAAFFVSTLTVAAIDPQPSAAQAASPPPSVSGQATPAAPPQGAARATLRSLTTQPTPAPATTQTQPAPATTQTQPAPATTQTQPAPATTQTQPAPATTQTQPGLSAPLTPWRALEDPKKRSAFPKRTDTGDPAGSLGWEIFGSVAPTVVAGMLLVAALEPGSSGHAVPFGGVNTPFLYLSVVLLTLGPPTGVAIAGSATGATSSAWFAYLGALAGLALSIPGIAIGSIVGYRLSADEDDDTRGTLSPVISRHEVALEWSGRL
jgi:hypothetical protein